MTTNYFKIAGEVIFFDSHDENSIKQAWAQAKTIQRTLQAAAPKTMRSRYYICVYRSVTIHGDWSWAHVIGHTMEEINGSGLLPALVFPPMEAPKAS